MPGVFLPAHARARSAHSNHPKFGATNIARAFGSDEFIIGATIVAVGTSAPELATTLIAQLRGYDEGRVGTVLGSNVFNYLLIVSVAALICPLVVT